MNVMKPLSPSPCVVGARRTLTERTPEPARARTACSERARSLPPVASSSSVAIVPGLTPASPEAMTSGRSEPSSAEPRTLDGGAVGGGGGGEVARERLLVLEREVDDAVGRRGGVAQDVEVVEGSADDLRARRLQGVGGRVRAGEPDDLVARAEELGDDGGADPAAGTGDEDAHGVLLFMA